jgi:nucleotide-binding universal stress UspA family protein
MVMATRPIVVGVDGSEESLLAAEWAATEAARHRAPLRIVSAAAMPARMRVHDAAPRTVSNALRGMCARAIGEAITRSEEMASKLVIGADVLGGPPATAVTDSGAGALMLVVGARGAGGFAALLLGSVSRYAAMHASCPVVVVRQETCAVSREVVVGIRDPHDTAGPLAFAFEEAALRGATLVAVHSCNFDQIPAEASRNLGDALTVWREKYPAVPVALDVVRGHPASVLASYSARADLVVIGRRGGPVTGPAVGAVQHAVLHHAHGPVAVVPAEP